MGVASDTGVVEEGMQERDMRSSTAAPLQASQNAARRFRTLLRALSRPGRIMLMPEMPGDLDAGVLPQGISAGAAATLLTLTDPETPVFIAGSDDAPPDGMAAIARWLAFETGAPRTYAPKEAVLAIGAWSDLLPLDLWAQGDAEFPDRSATLIVEVAGLDEGRPMTLSGPGIAATQRFAPTLPDAAAAVLAANAALAPLGVDFFFTAGRHVAGLPRSTRIGG